MDLLKEAGIMLARAGLVEPGWTLVMQIINFLILYFVLKHFLFVPVTEFIEKRKQGIQNSLDNASKKNQEAEDYKSSYYNKIALAETEGKQIIDKAVNNANLKAAEIIKEAKDEADGIKTKARKDIESERKNVLNEVKNEISSVAIMAASKVLEKEIDKSKNDVLIDKFIEEVGEIKWQN